MVETFEGFVAFHACDGTVHLEHTLREREVRLLQSEKLVSAIEAPLRVR